MDLEQSEKAAAEVQNTPNRVTLQHLEGNILRVEYINPESCKTMTIAVVTLTNGFVVIGKSAPADPENFNEELGKILALDEAKRQIWGYLGFRLKDKLTNCE